MHRRATLLWLVLASFVLTPFSTLHVHAAADHHDSVLHGGHLHDFGGSDNDDHGTDAEPIVDVQFVAADRGENPFGTTSSPQWTAVDATWASAPHLISILRPPIDDPPITHCSHWKPPLRGPPPVSTLA